MKTIIIAVFMVALSCGLAFGEASFDQIQTLIKNKEYSAAASGLELILKNHPNSSKANYTMSQAQAGLGNQLEAKKYLDKAKGLDPTLKFASSGNVENLQEALQPNTKKIEAIESHFWRNFLFIILFIVCPIGFFFWYRNKEEKKKEDNLPKSDISTMNKIPEYNPPLQSSRGYNNPRSQIVSGSDNYRPIPTVVFNPQPQTTIINNSSSNNGFVEGVVTGALLDHALSGHNTHETYVTERIVEKEVIREEPTYNRSWETKEESKSSSWDDSSSKSSSWGSSSSSSNSWDSGSSSSSWDSSSDSSSSSSWD